MKRWSIALGMASTRGSRTSAVSVSMSYHIVQHCESICYNVTLLLVFTYTYFSHKSSSSLSNLANICWWQKLNIWLRKCRCCGLWTDCCWNFFSNSVDHSLNSRPRIYFCQFSILEIWVLWILKMFVGFFLYKIIELRGNFHTEDWSWPVSC